MPIFLSGNIITLSPRLYFVLRSVPADSFFVFDILRVPCFEIPVSLF